MDGTVTGEIECDGSLEWYDYYDHDRIEFFNWQQTPTLQPDEPGVSCTVIFYHGPGDVKNGLGDTPCRAVDGDELASCYYRVNEFEKMFF